MNWKSILGLKVIGMLLVLALVVTIPVGYVAATENHHDNHFDHLIIDPIKTDAGYVSGTMIDVFHRCWIYYFDSPTGKLTCAPNLMGEVGESVRVYRGIPYAAPPIGDLRWKPPQPVTPWEGIRECTKFSPMAAQYPYPSSFFYGKIPERDISEDCLYLNVITPAKHANERLPVMVWFHGGGLTSGTNSPASVGNYVGPAGSWNGPPLPNHGLVLVTVQHRLGPIGYMAHPALTAESPQHASGNYGQLDLIASLQWVQKNIAAFGGDPHRIMIIGQSGGGSKVNGLVASPLAKGLFHRAVCQSGFSTGGTALATAEQQGLNLAAKLGVSDPGPDGLAALRAKSWQEIVTAANTPPLNYSTNHTVDGWYLTDTIANIFSTGRQNDVPYMMSFAGGEIGAFNPALGQILLAMSQNQRSKIYVDVFTQVPDGWKSQGVYAWHGSDVSYEFGDVGMGLGLSLGALLPTSLTLDPGVTEKDYWVSEFMMSMLAEFAETGNPSVRRMGVHWPAYNSSHEYYLDIGYPPLVMPGYSTLTTKQPPR
jgi:para-nitrobenzyl esterase